MTNENAQTVSCRDSDGQHRMIASIQRIIERSATSSSFPPVVLRQCGICARKMWIWATSRSQSLSARRTTG